MRISFEPEERQTLIARLGLSDDVTDEDIGSAFSVWANEGSDPGGGGGAGGSGPPAHTVSEPAPQGSNPGPRIHGLGHEPGDPGTPSPPSPSTQPPSQQQPTQQQPAEASQADNDDDEEDIVTLDIAAFNSLNARAARTEHLEEQARRERREAAIEAAINDGKFGPGRRDHWLARHEGDPEATEALIARMRSNVVPLDERGHDANVEEVEQDSYPPEWLPEVSARQEPVSNGDRATKRRSRIQGEV